MTVSLEKPAPAHGEGVAAPVEPNSRAVTPADRWVNTQAAALSVVVVVAAFLVLRGFPWLAAGVVAVVFVVSRLVGELLVRRRVKIISVTRTDTRTPLLAGQEVA